MWQIVGHEKVVGVLANSVKNEKLAHAYLFVGPPHVGKMTLAISLARALNCEGEEKPCGQCSQCHKVAGRKHADVRVIGLNGGMEIGIDQMREVQRMASLKPFEGRNRVFIIDGAEHLSHEAANCLLKTLEEPPPQVQMILLASNERLLLPTVLSRCQKLELRPLRIHAVEQALRERWHVAAEQAEVLARLSCGCLGWAVSALEDERPLSERSENLATLVHLTKVGLEERFAYAAELARKDRESARGILLLWLGWWRDLLLVRGGCGSFITNLDREGELNRAAQACSLRQIKEFIGAIQRAMEELDYNANPRLVLEVLMLNIPKERREGH